MSTMIDDTTIWLNNRYQLQQAIGAGGMAIVYKGFDTLLERTVAIKILKLELSKDQNFVDQFRTEAKSAANLSHKNIVTIYDFGIDQDRLFMVMEYVNGSTLKSIIKQRSPMPVQQALPYLIQSAESIGYAHRAGIIHCDVKPQNILVTESGRVKITDFGIARALSTISPDERHQVVWGSPQYFAPEQAAGYPPIMASDVYALGVILFELLTGRLPFNSTDGSELARMHREDPPPHPRSIVASIPLELDQIVLKVLSKEPSSRYRTADQLARILSAFLEKYNQPVNAPQQPAAFAPISANNLSNPITQQYASSQENKFPPPSPVDEFISTPLIKSPLKKRTESRDSVLLSQDEKEQTSKIDWLTITLGLLALMLTGGLIPFWLFIWLRIKTVF
jgi:eukaryotic-like serine/threonine-protein kinase